MNSSAENKQCGICYGSAALAQGEAIIVAQCGHYFHDSCIRNYAFGGIVHHCPVCNFRWKHPPFTNNFNYTNMYNVPLFNRRGRYHPYRSFRQPQFPRNPAVFHLEPLQFDDDEPTLPATSSTESTPVMMRRLTIKGAPERPAVAASVSVPLFTVLVGLKAPSLPDDAQRASVDIVTVLDVSSSMSGTKLDLVKRAVHFVIDNLGVSDRLSIVSFSNQARRMLPLSRMTENGRENAKKAVDSLFASGATNIVEGLKKGVKVLEERCHKNPVTGIIFLSDGRDNHNPKGYLHLLPASIYPLNRGPEAGQLETIPVHSFGFGSDHDPITMHAISDGSRGTFSFIESYAMIQDAFASCIGGLLSVVTQGLRLKVLSASHGVEIKSISSGRYGSVVSNQGSEGLVFVGDLYADEEKEFLINLSVPALPKEEGEKSERKTSLLDIMCSYKDATSKEIVQVEDDLVVIRRPKYPSPQDMVIKLEVDRQRNRLCVTESIQQAQQMAETGNLTGAKNLLAKKRTDLLASASAKAGDSLCMWLKSEIEEIERRMANLQLYEKSGRAYALAGMSSHGFQRATTKGKMVAGAVPPLSCGYGAGPPGSGSSSCSGAGFGGYATPQMALMVVKSEENSKKFVKSEQHIKKGKGSTVKKEYKSLLF